MLTFWRAGVAIEEGDEVFGRPGVEIVQVVESEGDEFERRGGEAR